MKHSTHIGNFRGVPVIQITVKFICIGKRFFHRSDIRDIPLCHVLIIELRGETRVEIDAVADQLEKALIENDEHLVYACSRVYG